MATTEQLHGLWWTPENPDHQVAGVLTLSDEAEPRLITHEALFTNFKDQTPCTVHGASGGRAISIFDSYALRGETTIRNGEEFTTQVIDTSSGLVIGDTHIGNADEPAFFSAQIEIDRLTMWANQATLEVRLPGENGGDEYTLTVPYVDPITVQYGDIQVTISTLYNTTLGGKFTLSNMSIPMNLSTVFVIESSTLLSASEYVRLSRRFADLITLAMFKSSDVRRVTLYRNAEPADPSKFIWWGTDSVSTDTDLGYEDRVATNFTLPDVDPVALFANWYQLHQTASYGMLSLVAMLTETTTYYENMLLAACGTIEALHKGLVPIPKRVSYKDRCKQLADIPPEDAVRLLIPDVSEWAANVVAARNHLAHGDEPHTRKLSEDDWFGLYRPTVALLILVAMTRLGVSGDVQLKALKQGALRGWKNT